MIENTEKNLKIINLENFTESDYDYKNKFCYFGYKKYNMNFKSVAKFLLVEAHLQDNIIEDNFFSEYDKSQILNN